MKGIGHNDVESYVRTLVSEGFGTQFEDAAGSTGPLGDPDPTSPPTVPDLPNNRKKDHGNGACQRKKLQIGMLVLFFLMSMTPGWLWAETVTYDLTIAQETITGPVQPLTA